MLQVLSTPQFFSSHLTSLEEGEWGSNSHMKITGVLVLPFRGGMFSLKNSAVETFAVPFYRLYYAENSMKGDNVLF